MFVGGARDLELKHYATAANEMCFFSLDFSCIVMLHLCLI